jgi:hypothetical protein
MQFPQLQHDPLFYSPLLSRLIASQKTSLAAAAATTTTDTTYSKELFLQFIVLLEAGFQLGLTQEKDTTRLLVQAEALTTSSVLLCLSPSNERRND